MNFQDDKRKAGVFKAVALFFRVNRGRGDDDGTCDGLARSEVKLLWRLCEGGCNEAEQAEDAHISSYGG